MIEKSISISYGTQKNTLTISKEDRKICITMQDDL